MISIFLIGGGGHCRACIDVVQCIPSIDIIGIIDPNLPVNSSVLGFPVLGDDSEIDNLLSSCHAPMIAVGQIKSPVARMKIGDLIKCKNAKSPIIFSPNSYVSKHSKIGEGSIVMHGAIINANVNVGLHAIINSKSLIEHDTRVGDYCHISTGAIINGGCEIGNGTFIGSGAIVRENTKIGNRVIVGAGTVVLNDIPDGITLRNPRYAN